MNIKTYHAARYPFLWLTTTEEERTIRQHRSQLKDTVKMFQWDLTQGFQELRKNGSTQAVWYRAEDNPTQDPSEALQKISTELPENSVIYCKDFHKFFESIGVIRTALNIKEVLKSTARMICFMSCYSPGAAIGSTGNTALPAELRNDITPFRIDLPTKEELTQTILRIASDNTIPDPAGPELATLSNALIGLTEELAENSLSASLVQNKRFDPQMLLREKARLIEDTAGLSFQEYSERLEDLIGNEIAIEYILKTAPREDSSCTLLYGIPGTGKSHIMKGAANALNWPAYAFSLGTIRSKFQGDTEDRLEKALSTADALGRSIIMVDEVDKFIAGSQGGADTDGGAGARIIGRLLQYFADRKKNGPYWIMTANSLQDILTISGGALVRRFDAMFFLDMPNATERKGIIKIWNKKMQVSIPENFNCEGYTGADIAKLARQMNMLGVDAEAARRYVIPTRQALGPRIEEIRKMAQSTCIPASASSTGPAPAPQRKIDKSDL